MTRCFRRAAIIGPSYNFTAASAHHLSGRYSHTLTPLLPRAAQTFTNAPPGLGLGAAMGTQGPEMALQGRGHRSTILFFILLLKMLVLGLGAIFGPPEAQNDLPDPGLQIGIFFDHSLCKYNKLIDLPWTQG